MVALKRDARIYRGEAIRLEEDTRNLASAYPRRWIVE